MKGKDKVIKELGALLAAELTSIDQYFIHSQMYKNWGYHRLYERIDHERQDEIGHATLLIERILFLEGTPDLATRTPLKVGKQVEDMLQLDLETEYAVAAALKKAIAICEKEDDFVSREILTGLLEDTESDHAYWLEQQLFLIKHTGLPNYLQSQTGIDQ